MPFGTKSSNVRVESGLGKLEQRGLRRIYGEGFGIDLAKLASAARNCLGLN